VSPDVEHLDALSKLPGDVVSLVGRDGRVRAISNNVERTLGFPVEHFIGHSGVNQIHQDDRQFALDAWDKVHADPSAEARYELRVTHADGNWRWVEVITRNLLDDPSVQAIVTNYRDITDRKLAEQALQASEERFRALVQHSSDVVLLMSKDLIVTYASPSLSVLSGRPESEIVGANSMTLVHPDDQEAVAYAYLPVFERQGATALARFRTQSADGDWRWVEATCVNLLDTPSVNAIVSNVRDVTEEKKAADALQRSEERFRALVQNSSDAIIVVDDTFTITYASPAIDRLFGRAVDDVVGSSGIQFVHPDDRSLVTKALADASNEAGTSVELELRISSVDDDWRWVEAAAVNLVDNDAVNGLVVHIHDITERKAAQDALIASEERYRALLENSTDAVVVVDEKAVVHYASPAVTHLFGRPAEELVGAAARHLVHPDDLAMVADETAEVYATPGATTTICARVRNAADEWRWVEVNYLNLIDDPRVEGIVIHIRDVTDTREARDALEANERQMRALVKYSDNIVEILDADATVVWVSPACEWVLGYTTSDLSGRRAPDLVHDDDRDSFLESFQSVLAGPRGTSATARVRVCAKDQSWKWLECVFTNRLGDAAVEGIIGNFRDITSQMHAEQSLRESERLFRSLAQSSPTGIYQQNHLNECIYVNERWVEITGLSAEEAMGQGWRRIMHPDDRHRFDIDRQVRAVNREPLSTEFRIVRPNGEVRWVALRTQPMISDAGELEGSVGAISDITDRMEAERDTQRLTDIFEATHDLVGIADRDGQLLYFNASAREFFGLPEHGGLDGQNLLQKFTPDVVERLVTDIQSDLERDGMWYGELAVTRADGVVIPVLAQLLNHTDEHGNFEFFSGVMHDISERKEFESQLAHQATHDPLTSLPNRVLLLERLQQALDRAQRHSKRVAVLFLDLDHFKVVNDSLGHGVGDRLLISIADRLKTVVRPGDTIARFGGDEFVVLCEDLETKADAVAVADRVNNVISGPFTVDDAEVFVGVSIGIAFPDDPSAEPGTLIRDADAAMYRAKEKGRARWEIFDNAMRDSAVDRLDIENALRRAQERRELRVFYQPMISLATGAIEGVEALIRWEHPERGLLLPNDFIHVAEETGLIVPMGAWVLEQACRQVMRWHASMTELGPLRLSVNLSGRQLGHPNLVADVRAIITDTHINPSQVELEITESVLMDDVEMSEDTLGQLKRLGVKLVVDDFGTGYSSLSYLRRFPVDVLKVDRSFVDGLGSDPSDSAIVTAIVTLAHTLGLSAIAEGVETVEQLEELRRLGCDMGQGFYMARPGTGHDIGELLAKRPTW
jgi:diguanylate cyclase (GGDEF)-like protein/PAS domain S-box-containing protein